MRRGRSYLAASTDVALNVAARSDGGCAGMGGTLPPGREVEMTAAVSGAPWSTMSLHTARGVIARGLVGRSGRGLLRWRGGAAGARFVRVEVRRCRPGRAMVALSNPIWLR